jgi:hypothetical protein
MNKIGGGGERAKITQSNQDFLGSVGTEFFLFMKKKDAIIASADWFSQKMNSSL